MVSKLRGVHSGPVHIMSGPQTGGSMAAALVAAANKAIGLEIKQEYDRDAQNLLQRSDHWVFLRRGIPAIFLTTGLHPDYHRPSDDAEKINGADTEKVARLLLATVVEAANAERLPKYRRNGLAETSEYTRAQFEQAVAAPHWQGSRSAAAAHG